MKSFKGRISLHREKEDNWNLRKKANDLGFYNTENLRYLGNEVEITIEVFENGSAKVLEVKGIDVSDKNITI